MSHMIDYIWDKDVVFDQTVPALKRKDTYKDELPDRAHQIRQYL